MRKSRFNLAAVTVGIVGLAAWAPVGVRGATSDLWGAAGERWDPRGVLPDFSFAGYRRGEVPVPDRGVDVSVKDFGAKGDGATDDTAAFKRALSEAAGKVILVPEGVYLITDILEITVSGTVLRGVERTRSVIYVPTPLEQIRPNPGQTGSGEPTTNYSWSGGIVWVKGSMSRGSGGVDLAGGVQRGATVIPVPANAQFRPGEEVILTQRDPGDLSFLRYLYRDDPGDASEIAGKVSRSQVFRIVEARADGYLMDRPSRYDIRAEWGPRLERFQPSVTGVGIEHLGFLFPETPYRGHFKEDGYNALAFSGVAHCWGRDLVIWHSDSGIYVDGAFNTISDIVIESSRKTDEGGSTGHHGITLGGMDNLCTRFDIRTQFIHDLTVESSVGCVFSQGRGASLSLDHHRRAPYENLFTSLDGGDGRRLWVCGGYGTRGRNTAAGGVYWNISARREPGMPPKDFGPAGLVFVGIKGGARKSDLRDGWHHERFGPGTLEPSDLHLAQLEARLRREGKPVSGAAGATAGAAAAGAVEEWTDAGGQKVQARFGGMQGATAVVLLTSDGKRLVVPLVQLSPASQQRARRLAAGGR